MDIEPKKKLIVEEPQPDEIENGDDDGIEITGADAEKDNIEESALELERIEKREQEKKKFLQEMKATKDTDSGDKQVAYYIEFNIRGKIKLQTKE
jgi:hypothetical protein